MSQQTDLYGVEKILIKSLSGDNKEMVFTDIREDTVKFTQSKGELTKIYTETNRSMPYRIFSNPGEGSKVEFALYASFEQLAFLMGGVHNETSYTPPSSVADIYRQVKIYTRKTDSQGSSMVITLPYAHLQTGIEANLKHNDIGYIEVAATAMKQQESAAPFLLEIVKG